MRILRPDETVWMSPWRHPITVRDAHFYWFGFDGLGVVDTAQALRRTARGRRFLPDPGDLPLCAVPGRLRLVGDPGEAPEASVQQRCLQVLRSTGRARRTSTPHIYELVPAQPVSTGRSSSQSR
jgi:hypothetical protein